MKIGIIGAGSIGSTIARRLSRQGHDVTIANSRGPETISAAALSTGARAVPASEAAAGVDVLIVSVPMNRNEDIAAHVRRAPEAAVVIDTSNYYPARDGIVAAFIEGQPESVWLSELFGRPVTKAWNAITSQSFDAKATEAGTAGRVAIPVYCTDRTREEMPAFLAAAEKARVPQRRDLAMDAIGGYIAAGGRVDGPFLVAINRACYS
jgi:predicted dinucleotide-binding enzyme